MMLLLLACFDPVECTTEAIASVTVTTSYMDTAYPAVVTATDAGGNEVSAECAPGETPDADGACYTWIVGWEVAGEINVHSHIVVDCNTGDGEATVTIAMDEDECHVVPQELDVEVTEVTDLGCMG